MQPRIVGETDLMTNTRTKQFAVLYVFVAILLSMGGILMGSRNLFVLAFAMLAAFPFVCKSFVRAITVMLVMYFLMDQVSFQILGGTFRIYFFFSITIIIFLSNYWIDIFKSPIMRAMVVWVAVGVLLSLLCDEPVSSLVSFISTILQMLSGFAIYLLLISGLIDLSKLDKLFTVILFVMFGFGIVQLGIYRVAGIGLGLNPVVAAGQLSAGQIPSLRYEGNALGKLLGWGILFCIPPLINTENPHKKKYKYLLAFLLLFLIISLTRTVLYSLAITTGFAICWYTYRNKGFNFIKTLLFLAFLLVVTILLIQFNVIQLGDYSLYKLQHMFLGAEEASQDGSAGYRLESMKQGFTIWFSSLKNTLMGVGYARATADLSSVGGLTDAEVGGCDLISIGVSFGVIGLILYLRILWKTFGAGLKTILKTPNGSMRQIWSERALLAVMYYLVLQSLAGSMLVPEFWMTFGIMGYTAYDHYITN